MHRWSVDYESNRIEDSNFRHQRDVFIFDDAVHDISVENYVKSHGRRDLAGMMRISFVRHFDCDGAALVGDPVWLLRLVLCRVLHEHDALVDDVLHVVVISAEQDTHGNNAIIDGRPSLVIGHLRRHNAFSSYRLFEVFVYYDGILCPI